MKQRICKRLPYTIEERFDLFKKMDELVKNGSTQADAAIKFGLPVGTYWNFKQQIEKATSHQPKASLNQAPRVVSVRKTRNKNQMVAFIGSPNDVIRAIQGISG